jgi:hypothetical protein
MGILETELNEMQILQEYNRLSLTRRLVPSGFIELVQKEFVGDAIIYNPLDDKRHIMYNHIAIAPSRAIINGYEVNLCGDFSYNGHNNYLLVDLGEAPANSTRDDLVYLEVWLECLTGNDNVKQWGYTDGLDMGYIVNDPRIKVETSRRVALHWNIRVKENIDFSTFPEGFGYNNVNSYSPIYCIANNKFGFTSNRSLIFANASNDLFKTCEFYKDNNLWVAGRPNDTISIGGIYGKYIYAIPMFRVKRRNKQPYAITNYNGAVSLAGTVTYNSAITGDLNSNIRPDKLYYDFITPQDLVDLRKTISIKEFNSEYYLDKSLKQLFTGQLQTKDTNQMRRVQFGNFKPDYTDPGIIFTENFNNAVNEDATVVSNKLIFKNAVGGYGLLLDGKTSIIYHLSTFNISLGMIDFYIQPCWYGTDKISQNIFSILDSRGKVIFKFDKQYSKVLDNTTKNYIESNQLVFSQYYDAGDDTNVTYATVNLSNNLILANNIYHVRLAWSDDSNIGSSYIYINGKICGQGQYKSNSRIADQLVVGAVQSQVDNIGFVMENLMIYRYINQSWGNLPEDFIGGNSLIFPSFNSTLSNFSDSQLIQTNTMAKLVADLDSENRFILQLPNDCQLDSTTPIVYSQNGVVMDGTWSDLDTLTPIFDSDLTVTDPIAKFNLIVPGGSGGEDLPNEILAAGILTKSDDGYTVQEASFNRKDLTTPRKVNFLEPRKIDTYVDTAYDYSTNRDNSNCSSRLLYYHMNGNNTDQYEIPANLYGYNVIGVVKVTGNKIKQCKKVLDVNTNQYKFIISLSQLVLDTKVVEFVLSLGGLIFDYETQSKTLISNIHKTKLLEITADGQTTDYVIPCFDSTQVNGGVLKSVFTISNDDINPANAQQRDVYRTCYVMNSTSQDLYYYQSRIDSYGNQVLDSYLATYTFIDSVGNADSTGEHSFGTPFLRVRLSWLPPKDTKILIPVLVSYQPLEDEVISIWYNYIPYQGVLSTNELKLKRISDWKYFMTTLSSGKLTIKVDESNVYSLSNIVNRLPGGLSKAYKICGQPIKLNYLSNSLDKSDLNTQLMFIKDIMFASIDSDLDNSFFELDTDFTIFKDSYGFQDGKIVIKDQYFKIYFPDCVVDDDNLAITKYTGMACLVLNQSGEIMLLVIGCLDETPSGVNKITPSFGDLFKIPNLPTMIQQY